VVIFYSATYWAGAPDFDTFRKSLWIEQRLNGSTGPTPRVVELQEPNWMDTEVGLESVHTIAYVEAVERGEPATLASSNGFTWTPGLCEAALCSSQGLAQAAALALTERRHTGSLSAGLHHASRDRGAGFCTFNGLALAARAAIANGATRILILDLDAHCGGGTWSIVSEWQEVWHADVSVNAFDGYERGQHPRGSLDIVRDANLYLPTIERVFDQLSATPFDLVIYNAGMDPFEHCTIGGLRGITSDRLRLRELMVFDWARGRGIPVAFTLAGGYTGGKVSRDDLVDLHLLTIDAADVTVH
jgi:acetoin utilization deacetylase AcuC-like enzyme